MQISSTFTVIPLFACNFYQHVLSHTKWGLCTNCTQGLMTAFHYYRECLKHVKAVNYCLQDYTQKHSLSTSWWTRISTLFWLCGGNDSCVVVSISVRQEHGWGGWGGVLGWSLTWPHLGWVTPVRQSVFGSFQHSRSVSYSSHSGLSALVWSSISWY